jgi:hypothetical protein
VSEDLQKALVCHAVIGGEFEFLDFIFDETVQAR